MLGLKQEALALELGEDWNQKKVSLLEGKEVVDDGLLEQVAKVLNIPKEAIRNLTDEGVINIVANTFHEGSIGYQKNEHCTFNPLEKLIQLHEEKIALYERMLKEKDDMMERLQRMLEERK